MQNQFYDKVDSQLEMNRNHVLISLIYKLSVPDAFKSFYNYILTNKPIDHINLTEIYFLVPHLDLINNIGWRAIFGNLNKIFLISDFGYETACMLSLQQIYKWINENSSCYRINSIALEQMNRIDNPHQFPSSTNNPSRSDYKVPNTYIHFNKGNNNFDVPYNMNSHLHLDPVYNNHYNIENKIKPEEYFPNIFYLQQNNLTSDTYNNNYIRNQETLTLPRHTNDPYFQYKIEQPPSYEVVENNQASNFPNLHTDYRDSKRDFYIYENTINNFSQKTNPLYDESNKIYNTGVDSETKNRDESFHIKNEKGRTSRGKKLSINNQAPPRGVRLEIKKNAYRVLTNVEKKKIDRSFSIDKFGPEVALKMATNCISQSRKKGASNLN